MTRNKSNADFYSTTEAAKLLGISRIAVFNRIKSGEIKARKVGRNYIIAANDLSPLLGGDLNSEEKKDIERVVRRAVDEYGEALDLLGRE